MKNENENFEKQLLLEFKKYGIIMPTDDFSNCRKDLSLVIPPIPAEFIDPKVILDRGYSHQTFKNDKDQETADRMAHAARNGKRLPKDILDKMMKDKNAAKRKD